jgi:hypothetical protein
MITEIRATSHDKSGMVNLEINTRCESIKKLAGDLEAVNPIEEISFSGDGPKTLRMAAKHCKHTALSKPSRWHPGWPCRKMPVLRSCKKKIRSGFTTENQSRLTLADDV